MARPLRRDKGTVDLSAGPERVSRIRRNPPPPPPRKVSPSELRAREARIIVVGLVAFGLAIWVILFQLAQYSSWSPGDYQIVIDKPH